MKRRCPLSISLRIVALALAIQVIGLASAKAEFKLERFDGGFFSIEKPEGWNVITAGACSSFAFLIRDPSAPSRQEKP